MKKIKLLKGKQFFGLALLTFLLLLTNGCASIISGKTQAMTFNSEPQGAKVTISGRQLGNTPITTTLERKKDQSIVFEKEGYKPVTMQLTTTLNPWFWGNIVLGGLIGSTTDGISGAYVEYAPSQYLIPLAPIEEKKANLEINKKIFIMMNYNNLVKELLFTEPGEYTQALIALMGVDQDKEDRIISEISYIASITNNGLTFAEKVTAISTN